MGWWSGIVGAVTSRFGGERPEAPPPGQYTSVDALVARMSQVQAALPDGDGLRAFNGMYLTVTELVRDRIASGGFADSAFMTRLDLVFAGLYLEAVDAAQPVSAWRPLFEQRHTPGVLSIQFALAGMNAHINHDLPIAVKQACIDLGTAPGDGHHHDDYGKVDELLDDAEQSVRQSFESGIVLEADRHGQAVLDLVCNWSMNSAREVAWDNALALWSVRRNTWATGLLTGTLARTVAMASRMLLLTV
jgi:Family of unknown function (DUF5995)